PHETNHLGNLRPRLNLERISKVQSSRSPAHELVSPAARDCHWFSIGRQLGKAFGLFRRKREFAIFRRETCRVPSLFAKRTQVRSAVPLARSSRDVPSALGPHLPMRFGETASFRFDGRIPTVSARRRPGSALFAAERAHYSRLP